MSHQRYPSDAVKEPHSVSLKVLRLSRPSLVTQYPLRDPLRIPGSGEGPTAASLAYSSDGQGNPAPFILSPILNLPPSFGSAYVGETFSCTLCANNDAADSAAHPGGARKQVRDVRIEAEMKTPGPTGPSTVTKLVLGPDQGDRAARSGGVDLDDEQTLQKIVNFDLKEEGNHVLAVTVSYYEATETSGRTRTFRKLYQFICKPSLIVRTKASLVSSPGLQSSSLKQQQPHSQRRWVLEAQLENCSEDAIQLERVALDPEPGLSYIDCNWDSSGSARPILHHSDVEQVCFVIEESPSLPTDSQDEKIMFGTLGIGWRAEMGNRGFLSTGKLGTRING